MAFLGTIGYIMAGSGLQEAWSTIYASKSTVKMLDGKHYARSVRAHFLTQLALIVMILKNCDFTEEEKEAMKTALDISLLTSSKTGIEGALERREKEVDDFENSSIKKIDEADIVITFMEKFEKKIEEYGSRGPTAALWVQYIKMVTLLKNFIRAERTGNLDLHLSTITAMLPFFHSCNRYHYAKCAHLYVQDMDNLKEKMNSIEEFDMYVMKHNISLRRSKEYFCGTSNDMIIEQTLMKRFHSVGGMIHGRGIEKSTITTWLNMISTSAYIVGNLEDYVNVESVFSEQHKDIRDSSKLRNENDLKIVSDWFNSHQPFPTTQKIISIATGLSGGAEINCHEAEAIGHQSMTSVISKKQINEDGTEVEIFGDFWSMRLLKNCKVLPLSAIQGKINTNNSTYPIDATVLFQRYQLSTSSEEVKLEHFSYELAPYPTSIFENNSQIRQNIKNNDISIFPECIQPPTMNIQDIIDAESLIQHIDWPSSGTYKDIYDKITTYIINEFPDNTIVVFNTAIAPTEHPYWSAIHRKSLISGSPEVLFNEIIDVVGKRDKILSNVNNKIRFLEQLSKSCSERNIRVVHTTDAGIELIMLQLSMTVLSTKTIPVVVSDDIDILFMLLTTFFYRCDIHFRTLDKRWYSTLQIGGEYSTLTQYLLLIRAFTGCKTTSSFHGKTIRGVLKSFKKNELSIVPLLKNFMDNVQQHNEELFKWGESIILQIYKGTGFALNLDQLRYKKYKQNLNSKKKTKLQIASLPPTSAAAYQHVKRVIWQINLWNGKKLSLEDSGWKKIDDFLYPELTVKPPATEEILALIKCKCKKCLPRSCSCYKSGLKCTALCENCTEDDCSNRVPIETIETALLGDNADKEDEIDENIIETLNDDQEDDHDEEDDEKEEEEDDEENDD